MFIIEISCGQEKMFRENRRGSGLTIKKIYIS